MAKSMVFMGFLSLLLLIQNIDADEFVIGGWGAWSLESATCNQWRERSRQQLGETVLHMYDADKSLLVKVNQDDCIICNATVSANATNKYQDGYSVVKLNQTGPNYSINGMVDENNNDKVIIHVMVDLTHAAPTNGCLPTQAPKCKSLTFLYVLVGILSGLLLMLVILKCIGGNCSEEARQQKKRTDQGVNNVNPPPPPPPAAGMVLHQWGQPRGY